MPSDHRYRDHDRHRKATYKPWALTYGYLFRRSDERWIEVIEPAAVFWDPQRWMGIMHHPIERVEDGRRILHDEGLMPFHRDHLHDELPDDAGIQATTGICYCWKCTIHRDGEREHRKRSYPLHRDGRDCPLTADEIELAGLLTCECGLEWMSREHRRLNPDLVLRG